MKNIFGIPGHRVDTNVVGQQVDNVEVDVGSWRKGKSKGMTRVNGRRSITDIL